MKTRRAGLIIGLGLATFGLNVEAQLGGVRGSVTDAVIGVNNVGAIVQRVENRLVSNHNAVISGTGLLPGQLSFKTLGEKIDVVQQSCGAFDALNLAQDVADALDLSAITTHTGQIPTLQSGIDGIPAAIVDRSLPGNNLPLSTTPTDIHTATRQLPTINTSVDKLVTDLQLVPGQIAEVVDAAAAMQALVDNVAAVLDDLPRNRAAGETVNDFIEDIQEMLADAEQLLNASRDQLARAGTGDPTQLVPLINGMQGLARAVMGPIGANIDLQPMAALTGLLPRAVQDLTGQGLKAVGITNQFVRSIASSVVDVTKLHSALEFEATTSTSCDDIYPNRIDIRQTATKVLVGGFAVKAGGKLLVAFGHTAASAVTEGVDVGVHGYALFKVKHSAPKKLGNILNGIGSAMISLAGTASNAVSRCEILHLLHASLHTSDAELLAHQGVLLQQLGVNHAETIAALASLETKADALEHKADSLALRLESHASATTASLNVIDGKTDSLMGALDVHANATSDALGLIEAKADLLEIKADSTEGKADGLLGSARLDIEVVHSNRLSGTWQSLIVPITRHGQPVEAEITAVDALMDTAGQLLQAMGDERDFWRWRPFTACDRLRTRRLWSPCEDGWPRPGNPR